MPRLTPIHWRKLCKVLEKAGCTYSHQEGDHVIYHKKGSVRPIVVPRYREIPEFIILKNLKTAGIERKTYFKLLGKK